MTIIEPQKSNRRINFLLVSSLSLSFGAVLWSVFVYNSTVNLARESSSIEVKHKASLTFNAELKNDLYRLLDAKNLKKLADREGLKQISNPEYLNVKAIAILAER